MVHCGGRGGLGSAYFDEVFQNMFFFGGVGLGGRRAPPLNLLGAQAGICVLEESSQAQGLKRRDQGGDGSSSFHLSFPNLPYEVSYSFFMCEHKSHLLCETF